MPTRAHAADAMRVAYKDEVTQVRAVLFRRAPTGAWVPIGEATVSYPMAQAALARVEGTPGPDEVSPEELGFAEEIVEVGGRGRRKKRRKKRRAKFKKLAGRVVKVAKKVAKNKVLRGAMKKLGKFATSVVPGGNMVRTGFKAARGAVNLAKGRGLSSITNELGATRPRIGAALRGIVKRATPQLKLAATQKARQLSASRGKPISPQTVIKAAAMATQLQRVAPKLAAITRALPATAPAQRSLVARRAAEGIKKIASLPPEQRAAAAAIVEKRLDAWKVISPQGTEIFVPAAVVGK